jgi:hypothetical protein
VRLFARWRRAEPMKDSDACCVFANKIKTKFTDVC